MQIRTPLELEKQCQASCRFDIGINIFLSRSHRAVTPLCFGSILGVTVESVQGRQVYLEWIGTLGSFGMVARPLEFLSSVKLKPPYVEVRWERRDSFPNEAGKWTLILR